MDDDWLTEFVAEQKAAIPGLKLDVSRDSAGNVIVHRLVVPIRNQGTGRTVMTMLLAHADAAGDTVALTPSKAFGGSVTRLTRWYTSMGFRHNRGRRRDFSTQESMIRKVEHT